MANKDGMYLEYCFVVNEDNKIYQFGEKGLTRSWGTYSKIVFTPDGTKYIVLQNGKLLFDSTPPRGVDFKKLIKYLNTLVLSKKGDLYRNSPKFFNIFDGAIKDILVVPGKHSTDVRIFVLNEHGKLFITDVFLSIISRIKHRFDAIYYHAGAIYGKLLQEQSDQADTLPVTAPLIELAKGLRINKPALDARLRSVTDEVNEILDDKKVKEVAGGETTITFLASDGIRLYYSEQFLELIKEYDLEYIWSVTLSFSDLEYVLERFGSRPPDRDFRVASFKEWPGTRQYAVDICRLAALLEILDLKVFFASIRLLNGRHGYQFMSLDFGKKDFSRQYEIGSGYAVGFHDLFR